MAANASKKATFTSPGASRFIRICSLAGLTPSSAPKVITRCN